MTLGGTLTLDAIAAVLVGGTAIAGGRGSALRTLGGAVLISVISDVLLLRGYSTGAQILVKGVLVLAVVVAVHLRAHAGAAMIRRSLARPERSMPPVALLLVVVAFACSPLRTGPAATFDVYNALQGFAQLGLLALAIGLTMIAGEFDLSVVGTYALGGMVAVQTGRRPRARRPGRGGCGAGIGAVQGGLIAGLRIPSMPVTLATYIALLGLTYAMSGGLSAPTPTSTRPVGRPDRRRRVLAAQPDHPGGVPARGAGAGRHPAGPRAAGGRRRPPRQPGRRCPRGPPGRGSSPCPARWPRSAAPCSATASRPPTPTRACGRSSSPRWPRCSAASPSPAAAGRRWGCSQGRSPSPCSPRSSRCPRCPTTGSSCSTRPCSPSSSPSTRSRPASGGRAGFVRVVPMGAVMGNLTFDFSGRTVLLTGAARGVGRALGEHFRDSGAAVYLVDVDEDEVTATAKEIGAVGLAADVTDSDQVRPVERVVSDTGRLDVLVNNAGILRDGLVWKLSDDDYESVMAVHAGGTFRFTRAAVPHFRRQGSGRIINVTSYTGMRGNPGQSNYAMAKAGIIGFTKTTAKELARFGTTVNAISPNAQTRMITRSPPPSWRSWPPASRWAASPRRPRWLLPWRSWPRTRPRTSPAWCSPSTAASP